MKNKLQNLVKKSSFLSWMKLNWFRRKWRHLNQHNFTTAGNAFDCKKVSIAKGTYGTLNVYHFGSSAEELRIGSYCSIGPECAFVLGGEHDLNKISTYPFNTKFGDHLNESITKGPIIIDDDVWLGFRATILSGVHIGQGAVVAAGAVVAKDVAPYSVVGGVPAVVLKRRFNDEQIVELLKIDYSKIDASKIEQHIQDFNRVFDNTEQLHWLPKKD